MLELSSLFRVQPYAMNGLVPRVHVFIVFRLDMWQG